MMESVVTFLNLPLLLAQAGAATPAAAPAPAAVPAAATGPPGVLDLKTFILLGIVLGLLIAASIVGRVLRRSADTTLNPAMVKTFRSRVNAWWTMYAILIAGFL